MARQKKTKADSPVIESTINHPDGKLHETAKELPTVRSVGVFQAFKGSSEWVSVVITTKGDKVIKVEAEEPNMKAVAVDMAKIKFVKLFAMIEG